MVRESFDNERQVYRVFLKMPDHRPRVYAVGDDYLIEEFVENIGDLPVDRVWRDDAFLRHMCEQFADFHYNKDLQKCLPDMNHNSWYIWENTNYKNCWEFCKPYEATYPNFHKALRKSQEEFNLDERVFKGCLVHNPVLGKVACHNDAHAKNWLSPKDDPDHPFLLDYEFTSLDFAGADLGCCWTEFEWLIPAEKHNSEKLLKRNEKREKKMIKMYLEAVYKKHLMNQPELAKKYKGKSFEYFYNDVVQQFTMECYKGLAIRCQLGHFVV